MYHSFILIKSPQICGDEKFRRYKQLVSPHFDVDIGTEILDVVAFNCDDVEKIPDMVAEIFHDYKHKSFTDKNHEYATIMGACYAWLMENERQDIPDYIQHALKQYDIKINAENCIYVPIPDFVFALANHVVKKLLLKNI